MDELTQICGSTHRKFRHDVNRTPNEAKQIFGELADQACIVHILLDNQGHKLVASKKPMVKKGKRKAGFGKGEGGRRKGMTARKIIELVESKIPRDYEAAISFSSLAKRAKLNYLSVRNALEMIDFIQDKMDRIVMSRISTIYF